MLLSIFFLIMMLLLNTSYMLPGFMESGFFSQIGKASRKSYKKQEKMVSKSSIYYYFIFTVIVAGFMLGKSPNPMEGIVKVVKSMVGLYPDPHMKIFVLLFFLVLAFVGNKLICGWACPFGALQELIYLLPI